jgi:DGQHR domain-containing protein
MAAKKKAKASKETSKKTGNAKAPLKFDAIKFSQGEQTMYLFTSKASVLYDSLSINRRVENKDEGYQRTLSLGRVQAIAKFVQRKKTAIPSAIIVCFDEGDFDAESGVLSIPSGKDVGWVIDGQHRLAGCHAAAQEGVDIELAVVGFVGLDEKKQIEQFVTINRESKNVPTSLYLDLLKKLPFKNAADSAKERATDIATQLRRDEDSVFFERIAITSSPKDGQISLVNFVRKIAPLVSQDKGLLGTYTVREQTKVVNNYFKALSVCFPKEFDRKGSIFFKTIGFGALWNVFQNFFSQTLKKYGGFQVKDALAVFNELKSFDFDSWREYGTGSQAELSAADDLRTALLLAFRDDAGGEGSLKV